MITVLKILLATDGDKHFGTTSGVARKLLQESADVQVLVVYVSNTSVPYYQRTKLGIDQNLSPEEARFVRETERIVAQTFSPWAHRVTFRHRIGDPVRQICQVARDEGMDFIIVGNHHKAGDRFGSVCEGVMAAADRPVVAVK